MPELGVEKIVIWNEGWMEIVHFCPYLGLVSLHGWQLRALLVLTKEEIIYLDMKADFLIAYQRRLVLKWCFLS